MYMHTVREIEDFAINGTGVFYSVAADMPLACAINIGETRLLLINEDVGRSKEPREYEHLKLFAFTYALSYFPVIACSFGELPYLLPNDIRLIDAMGNYDLHILGAVESDFANSLGLLEHGVFYLSLALFQDDSDMRYLLLGSRSLNLHGLIKTSSHLLIDNRHRSDTIPEFLRAVVQPVYDLGFPDGELYWYKGFCLLPVPSFIYSLSDRSSDPELQDIISAQSHLDTVIRESVPMPTAPGFKLRSSVYLPAVMVRRHKDRTFALTKHYPGSSLAWYEVIFLILLAFIK